MLGKATGAGIRALAQAIAPLVFGGLADLIAGIAPKQAPIGTHPVISPGSARGLQIEGDELPSVGAYISVLTEGLNIPPGEVIWKRGRSAGVELIRSRT